MKRFLWKILLSLLPIIILVGILVKFDPLKIFGFQDYYSTGFVGLNRGMITTTTYNHYREQERFNSFIFGSSRSQAYKCKNWLPHLEAGAKPFHFDASSESLWGLVHKLMYVDSLEDPIQNALIIIDRSTLYYTKPKKGHLFVDMPCISHTSKASYYTENLGAMFHFQFMISYIDYSIFRKHRDYMQSFIKKDPYRVTVNPVNCDLWFGEDIAIKTDSLTYYENLINKGTFYKRQGISEFNLAITTEEIALLKTMMAIFNRQHTAFKIVISPTYDQIPMEPEQLELLYKVFGKNHIYNFSGKNKLTEPISNFYENSHYKPSVANFIMDSIYGNK